jgi:predicted enzyme related to lactoylglutathione lyase
VGLNLSGLEFDAADARALAEFWAAALGGEVRDDATEEYVVVFAPSFPGAIGFGRVPEGKSAKNRLHVDLKPDGTTQDQEVARLEGLGARRIDVGQGPDVSWVVMADPEGNEFCVL